MLNQVNLRQWVRTDGKSVGDGIRNGVFDIMQTGQLQTKSHQHAKGISLGCVGGNFLPHRWFRCFKIDGKSATIWLHGDFCGSVLRLFCCKK